MCWAPLSPPGQVFLDKLETDLKGTPQEHLVPSLFTGTSVNQVGGWVGAFARCRCSLTLLPSAWVPVQVICKTCGTVGEREEAFHHIPLDVKINNNIHDAFSQFVNGETISDYK
jgi:hypothetical protein